MVVERAEEAESLLAEPGGAMQCKFDLGSSSSSILASVPGVNLKPRQSRISVSSHSALEPLCKTIQPRYC